MEDYQKEPFTGKVKLKISLATFRKEAAEDFEDLRFFIDNFGLDGGGQQSARSSRKSRKDNVSLSQTFDSWQKGARTPMRNQAGEKLKLGKDFDLRYRVVSRHSERVGSARGQVVMPEEAQTFINVGMLHNQDEMVFTKTPHALGTNAKEDERKQKEKKS